MAKDFEKNSIMVWGAVSIKGNIYLELCQKTIDSDGYIKILQIFHKKAIEKYAETIIYSYKIVFLVMSVKTKKFLDSKDIVSLDCSRVHQTEILLKMYGKC